MDTCITETGYLLLTVAREYGDNRFTIKQVSHLQSVARTNIFLNRG